MVDMDTFVAGRIDKLVNNIITSENHILNDCYSCPRTQNLLPIVRKNRFLQSFIPMSMKVFIESFYESFVRTTELFFENHCNLSLTVLLINLNL